MEKPPIPKSPKSPSPIEGLREDLKKYEQESDLEDGKIKIDLVYDMKTGILSMGSGAPEIMVLGVLNQAILMVGQKQILKTFKDAQTKSLLLKR